MSTDPEGLVTFEAGGKSYTAVFGFRAMKAVEAHYDLPFFQALQRAMPALKPEDASDAAKIAEAGASVRLTEVGRLFQFSLAKHHPDIGDDEVEDLVDELGFERVGQLLGSTVSAALVKEGDGGSSPNPRKTNGSRVAKTG